MAVAKRPGIITLIGILGILGGIFKILGGLFIVFDDNRALVITDSGLTTTGLIWVGIVMIVIGLIGIFIANAILSGQRWARVWYGFIATLNVVAGFWSLVAHQGESRWTGLAAAIIWLIVLQFLFNDKADAFFDEAEV